MLGTSFGTVVFFRHPSFFQKPAISGQVFEAKHAGNLEASQNMGAHHLIIFLIRISIYIYMYIFIYTHPQCGISPFHVGFLLI